MITRLFIALFCLSTLSEAGVVSSRRARHVNPRHAGATLALDARFITGLNDGDAVSTWADRSGSANDATQGTALNRPLYRTGTSGINRTPAVVFDGSNDFLSSPVAPPAATKILIIAVVQSNTVDNAWRAVISNVASGSIRRFTLIQNGGFGQAFNHLTYFTVSSGSTWSGTTSPLTQSVPVVSSNLERNDHSVRSWFNGTLGTNSGTSLSQAPATTTDIGRYSASNVFPWSGPIGSITILPQLTDPLRRRFEQAAAFAFKIRGN